MICRTCIYADITLQVEQNPQIYCTDGLEFSLLCTQEHYRSWMWLRILSCIYWQQGLVTALELALSWFCLQVPDKSWVWKWEFIYTNHCQWPSPDLGSFLSEINLIFSLFGLLTWDLSVENDEKFILFETEFPIRRELWADRVTFFYVAGWGKTQIAFPIGTRGLCHSISLLWVWFLIF